MPEDPLQISALQHYSYCPRQCALIHLEQTFTDNIFTIRGNLAHQRVDSEESGEEYGTQIERTLPLYSQKYQLSGKADAVEFHEGTPYPIEYKQGKRHQKQHDDIQLAAQALCLEEMTGKEIAEGAIYHHKSKRRRIVKITKKLRQQTIDTIKQTQKMLAGNKLPPPTTDEKRCRACSLRESCQPDIINNKTRIQQLKNTLFATE